MDERVYQVLVKLIDGLWHWVTVTYYTILFKDGEPLAAYIFSLLGR